MMKFYDTCSLLLLEENLFSEDNNIVISSISLEELENIKTSTSKDSELKFKARKLLRLLDNKQSQYEIVVFTEDMLNPIADKHLSITNDTKILACAIWYDTNVAPDETIFVTNDLALKNIANLFFGEDSIQSVSQAPKDNYTGFLEKIMDNEEMANFYSHMDKNLYNLNINQYLIIRNTDKEIVDTLCWTGTEYRMIEHPAFNSSYFGEIKPYKKDIYQTIAADALLKNKITMLRGSAGTGKSYLALGYLMNQLERGRIDHIIVFCNPVATKDSARLGFYPGSKNDKLLDSQIGNMLASKFGGQMGVEQMIQQEKLILLPFSDIRGYDTSGLRAGVYITEAQNLNITLMKLALQRIGEDSICVIDGDDRTQVDLGAYAGDSNGMRRVSQVFRGQDLYGEVTLQKIHRSRIAEIAEGL